MAIDLKFFFLVSENHGNVDLFLGIKNIFELEGVIDSCDFPFSFLNRLIPFFPKEKTKIKSKEQRLVVVEAPFYRGNIKNGIVKVLDMQEEVPNMIKLKFIRIRATLKITNKHS